MTTQPTHPDALDALLAGVLRIEYDYPQVYAVPAVRAYVDRSVEILIKLMATVVATPSIRELMVTQTNKRPAWRIGRLFKEIQMSSAFVPSDHSHDNPEFPPEADTRDCHDSPPIATCQRPEIWLTAERIGVLCQPPLAAFAIAFEAELHEWRSQTRRSGAGRSKRVFSLTDAIRTLRRRLAAPLIEAVLDRWATRPVLPFPPKRKNLTLADVPERARRIVGARLAALDLWRRTLARRRKRENIETATIKFAAAWNASLADRYGIRLSKTRLFAWRAAFKAQGVIVLIDARWRCPEDRRRVKAIPRDFWLAFCRRYFSFASPPFEIAWRGALDDCPADSRAEWSVAYKPDLFRRRVASVPAFVREQFLINFAQPPKSDSDSASSELTQSLARSRCFLSVLAIATRPEGQP